MKTITTISIFTILMLLVSMPVLAQKELSRKHVEDLKIGIYKTYQEFITNNPSIPFDYHVEEKKKNTGGYVIGRKTIFYKINIDREKAQEIGQVYGFSDGINIYINEYMPILKPSTLFMKVMFANNYCVFEYKRIEPDPQTLPSKNKVIDLRTGKFKVISRNRIIKELHKSGVAYK